MGRTWGPWSEHDAGDGWKYYYHSDTKESMWEMPIEVREELGLMEDMMKTALAFSGEWGAFDAGFGTIYYFHLPSSTSSWERPKEWGIEPEMSYTQLALLQEKEKLTHPNPSTKQVKEVKEGGKQKPSKKKCETKQNDERESEKQVEETEEEKELHFRRIEAFREMLREKDILPTFKWEAVLPRIAIDDRFRAIPSMDERRAIFEYFIKHRKAEIAAQMKSNMKKAKKAWAQLVEKTLQDMPLAEISKKKWTLEQFRAYMNRVNIVDDATTSVLPLAIQESVYEKKRDLWYPKAMCRRLEYKRLVDLWNDHKTKVMDAEEYTDPVIAKLRTQVDIEHLTAIDEEEIFATCQEEYRNAEAAAVERRERERQEEAERKEMIEKQEALHRQFNEKRDEEERQQQQIKSPPIPRQESNDKSADNPRGNRRSSSQTRSYDRKRYRSPSPVRRRSRSRSNHRRRRRYRSSSRSPSRERYRR